MLIQPLLAATFALAPLAAQDVAPEPAAAPLPPLPEELVLSGDNIITVLLNGVPVRLEVTAEAFGPPVINPEIAVQLQVLAAFRRNWLLGPVEIEGGGVAAAIDFGAGPGAVPVPVTWARRPVTDRADGIIGVHHLPYARVTFAMRPPAVGETVQRFALKRAGGDAAARLGTEVTVGKKRLMMIFVSDRDENLITAPTANFIATHHEGGFEAGSERTAMMNFGVERPTRIMRLAQPIELGALLVDRFAVRIEDYGAPKRVGEIGENDPRFEKGQILVSRRKGRGSPDLLTRLGRDQIKHCSSLTYDLAGEEISLTCIAQGE